MKFPMTDYLRDYDVFPLVYPINQEVTVHIRPLGCIPAFAVGAEYSGVICATDGGDAYQNPLSADFHPFTAVCNKDGGFDIPYTFTSEQRYIICFYNERGSRFKMFDVYAVEDDLIGRLPLRGDLHIHTYCSDAAQSPEVVCAAYRSHGYDFFGITDHHKYYPSLRALDFCKSIPTEFVTVPGEEVHLPDQNHEYAYPHVINFGGLHSVNAMIKDKVYYAHGGAKEICSVNGDAPDAMTEEEFHALMTKLEADFDDAPDNVGKHQLAVTHWVFEQIKKADGLAIFPHPYWMNGDAVHVPEPMTEYIMEKQKFDAFEVLSGENYYECNGFQTIRYYEDKAKGRNYPVVGSTDSHNAYLSNRNALICSTLVFSPANERKALINSIKDFYSVAIDTISKEFRLVGDSRLARYACFLLKNYFPRHDELCLEEGRLMKICATGTADEREDAVKTLEVINGRVRKLMKKYLGF